MLQEALICFDKLFPSKIQEPFFNVYLITQPLYFALKHDVFINFDTNILSDSDVSIIRNVHLENDIFSIFETESMLVKMK